MTSSMEQRLNQNENPGDMIERVVVLRQQASEELPPTEDLEFTGTGQTPMIRGVPNRRTFDSGYGDGQSSVSSPVAEPKKASNSELYAKETNRSRMRLRRQKAVDRSCPSSAQSARSRLSTHSTSKTANSSTDYEDNEYDDDSFYPRSCSVGGLNRGDSGCHMTAYGRLRRNSSITSSSDEMLDDEEDDECNTSDSGGESSMANKRKLAIINQKLKATLPSSVDQQHATRPSIASTDISPDKAV